MRSLLLIIILICLGGYAEAQLSLERQVVSSGGAVQTSGQLNLSATIGEAVIETVTQGTLTLTQGFQQGSLDGSVNIDGLTDLKLNYEIFPNPTNDKINVNLSHPGPINLSLSLFDQAGKKVIKDQLLQISATQMTTQLDIEALASGLYYLVFDEGKSGTKVSFKVEKL